MERIHTNEGLPVKSIDSAIFAHMKRNCIAGILWGQALLACAQLEIPGPLQLNGPDDSHRQVIGLAAPAAADAAMSVDAARNEAVSFSTASGALWQVNLTPAPDRYSAGMLITVLPDAPNAAGVQVDVNGLGAREVVKTDGSPLDTAEVRGGMPARLLYDGNRFVLMGSAYRPCPPGYSPAGRAYCIADSSREALNFFDAINVCASVNARLCSYAEWIAGCMRTPGFLGTIVGPEWVDNASNNTADAKTVGVGGDGQTGTPIATDCDRGSTTPATNLRTYRCCRLR